MLENLHRVSAIKYFKNFEHVQLPLGSTFGLYWHYIYIVAWNQEVLWVCVATNRPVLAAFGFLGFSTADQHIAFMSINQQLSWAKKWSAE